jgi:hypothetical protein
MAEPHPQHGLSLSVRSDQPLIGIIGEAHGEEVVYYFTEEEATAAVATPESIQDALNLAGAWRDLDWEEAAAALDRIRHQSQPTPPIEQL